MKTEIDLSPVEKFKMGSGIGNGTINGGIHGNEACFVAQAAIIDAVRNGRKITQPTDQLEPACPLMRRLGISINDGPFWNSSAERASLLRPLIPLLLDSAVGLVGTKKRGLRYVDCWVREITPMIADALNQKEASRKLRALVPIVDVASIASAHEVCAGISSALAVARELGVDLALDLAVALELDLARASTAALALDLAVALERDLARASTAALDLALGVALDLALAVALELALALDLDLALALRKDIRDKLISLFKELAEIKD